MATIYLIRHGQASFGADNYDELSELGRRQAVITGEYLRDCGITLDAAYSGDLSRQRETASLALASQPVPVAHHIDPRFNEIQNDEQIEHLLPQVTKTNPAIQALVDKGLSDSKDYQKVIDAVFNYWVSEHCNEPAIQSWDSYSSNARAALRQVMDTHGSGKTIGVFASGGTIATLVAQILGVPGAGTYQFYEPIINCSVTQIFYNGSKVSLSYFNDSSFLRVLGQQRSESLITYR